MSSELYAPKPAIAWTPHKLQKNAVKWFLMNPCAALFASPGVGKSSVVLAALKLLKKRGVLGKVLLVAPLRVCYQVWPNEVRKWKDFNGLKVIVLHGPSKEALLDEEADIYCINPEGLDWLLGVEKMTSVTGKKTPYVNLKRFRSFGFTHLIIDELTKFKHPQTMRFKALKQVLPYFLRRWGLTGSPAANGLMDLFGQIYVLDCGHALGQYVTNFRARYCVPSFDGSGWQLAKGAEAKIYEAIAPLVMRIGDDHLDLPKLVENKIEVALPAAARKVYMQLEDLLIAEYDQGFITAANTAVASGKCRQVASGAIFVDDDQFGALSPKEFKAAHLHRSDGRLWASLHDAKIEALEDLVEELQGQPLLVAYDFRHTLFKIKKKFPDARVIGGGTTPKEAQEIEWLWNEGRLPMLVGHPQAMGHGLNLQAAAAAHVCWADLTWNFELYEQLIKRLHRQGNKAPRVFNHLLMAEGTIDEAIYWALKNKGKGQNALFEAIKLIKKRRIAK